MIPGHESDHYLRQQVVTFPYRNAKGEHVRCPFCSRAWGACSRSPCDAMGRFPPESSANEGGKGG